MGWATGEAVGHANKQIYTPAVYVHICELVSEYFNHSISSDISPQQVNHRILVWFCSSVGGLFSI